MWSQLCLELSRSERSCPLHPALQQASLTAFKDRAGRWLLHPEPTVDVDVDLPERSYWLLAPLEVPQEALRVGHPGQSGRQGVDWHFVDWALDCWRHFRSHGSWPELESALRSGRMPMARPSVVA